MGFGGPMQGASAIQGMGDTNAIPNPYGIDTTGHQSGLLGGVIADQKRAMAQQLFGQQNQANQTDLAEQALTLQRNQADEAAFGQKQRELTGKEKDTMLNLYNDGTIPAALRAKKLSELSADEAQMLADKYKMLQQKLDVGRQQAAAIDPSSGSLPPGYIQEANKQRQAMGIDLLPEDMPGAVKQLQKEHDLSMSSGARVDAAQKAYYEQALKKQEAGYVQKKTETEVAGRENVAKIETMTQKTPDNVMAGIERRLNNPTGTEAQNQPLTSQELSSLQEYKISKAPKDVTDNLATKIAALQRQMKNPDQTEADRQAVRMKAYEQAIPGWTRIELKKQELLKQEAAAANKTPDVPDNPQRQAQRAGALNSQAAQDAQTYGGRDSYQSPVAGSQAQEPTQTAVQAASKWDKTKVQPLDGWNYKYNPKTDHWDPIGKVK